MTTFILICIALVGIAALIIWIQLKRIRALKTENKALFNEIDSAAARLEHIRDYIRKNNIAMEESDAKRKELNATPDGELVRRAHNLFDGGVRGDTSGSPDAA